MIAVILKHIVSSFVLKVCNVLFFFLYLFIYLAAWGLSRGTWHLPHCIMQDLSMRHTDCSCAAWLSSCTVLAQ